MNTPMTQTDGYKLTHHGFMRKGTTKLVTNMTARSFKYAKVPMTHSVFFGLQAVIKKILIKDLNENFFGKPKEQVIARMTRRFNSYAGSGVVSTEHMAALHDLGHLPVDIWSLPEGSKVPEKVPYYIIFNTHPDFAWVVNFFETVMSSHLWHPTTTASTMYAFRKMINDLAMETVGNLDSTGFQLHEFAYRGYSGTEAAAASGAAFLLSSFGTDTLPAIDFLEQYYNADCEKELIAMSVPASEHALASLGIAVDGEEATLRRWITEDYPTGIVSIISDTKDFWNVITNTASNLKEDILARQPNEFGLAKTVFRPDSGDPVKVITGYTPDEIFNKIESDGSHTFYDKVTGKQLSVAEIKGAVECLWDIFGGTKSDKGYDLLHERVGLIYGDSITYEIAEETSKRLMAKGFASTNVVYGIGSFMLQYVTRDTLGMALKATYAEVDGVGYDLEKDPVTDSGVKKSAKGFLNVQKTSNGLLLVQGNQAKLDFEAGRTAFRKVFSNSHLLIDESLQTIRGRLWNE